MAELISANGTDAWRFTAGCTISEGLGRLIEMRRREFITSAAAALAADAKTLSRKERVDRALHGKDVDRTPFTFWHHFGLKTPEEHVKATLEFHAKYRTDIVKVM